MDKLESVVYKYVGKIKKSEGIDKNGNKWQKWNLQFDSGGQYPWKANVFSPISPKSPVVVTSSENKDASGQPVASPRLVLEEDQYYEIVYKTRTYTHPQHGSVTEKQVVLIKPASADKVTTFSSAPDTTPKKEDVVDSMQKAIEMNWPAFKEAYLSQMKAENKPLNQMHMLGTYMYNYYEHPLRDLIKRCEGVCGSD